MIVPARDAAVTVGATLAALSIQELEGEYEVILVDDGSRDRTAEIARRAPGPVRVLTQPPLGPAAARNLGVAHSNAPTLAFCDADVLPTPGWLAAGVDALKDADIVQGKVLPDPEAPLGPFDRSLWITYEVGLFETANLFVSREMFDRVGGFEQWLHPRWGKALAEDVWFGYRARRMGARSTFGAKALAYHAVFPRGWREYVLERARLWYFPAMTRRMPELRRTFLYRGLFLRRRTAMLHLAGLGLGAALRLHSPVPLLATVPYLSEVRRHSMRSRPRGPRASIVSMADVMADGVGELALIGGSVRQRTPVL